MKGMALKDNVDPKVAALVVVDVQNDFCHEKGALARAGLNVRHMKRVVPRLASFLEEARSSGVRVIFIKTVHTPWTHSEARKDWGTCLEGSWGQEFYGVQPKGDEPVVVKHRYGAFSDTDLDLILRSQKVKSLIVVGVATNVCVESTVREAYMKDYHVVLVSDCCAAASAAEHRAALYNTDRFFGTVALSQEIVEAWRELKVLPRGKGRSRARRPPL